MAKMKADRTNWPIKGLAGVSVLSLVLASVMLPSLDGAHRSAARLAGYLVFLAVYWIRIVIAYKTKEQSGDFFFYVILILVAPFIIWPIQDLVD
ncbi:MAG: hypothetical protein GY869_28660 [Planctomycetes bacterium]|nr:hypothetical protein [Planctomycetota bacterium]